MYKVRNENKRIPIKVNSNLRLYEAIERIRNVHGGIVIDQKGLVAFWCSHFNMIRPGFKANEYEREQIICFY